MGRRRKHVRKPNQRRRTARPKLRKLATGGADLREQLDRRTQELDDLLQYQMATSEVLSIIRRSPADAQPVFDAIVQSASRLTGAMFGVVYLYEDDHLRIAATNNFTPAATLHLNEMQQLKRPERSHLGGRAILDRKIVHVPDVLADPEYSHVLALAGGWRAVLAVPLIRDGMPLGVLTAAKAEAVPFSDRQIKLLETFADQAIIAIENTRRFSELNESLQQQTATADVLKVIAGSTGVLTPVFKTMLENAVRICDAKFGHMFLSEGEAFRVVALESGSLPYPGWLTQGSKLELRENPRGPLARITTTRKIVHIGDLTAEAPYLERNPRMVALVESSGARTFLGVPMFKGETLIGTIGIYRQEVKPFTDKQVELVTNFAAQAVIAIENARLLNELRERTHELATSLDNLRTTQDRLVQTQKLASLGQLTAGIAHEMKNPLNFVNNFSGLSSELIDELQQSLKDVSLDDNKRGEVAELMNTLRDNLDKVVQHGKRADAIVKNMLQHSRESTGEHRPVDINALVEESLNLAWHGARAEKQGFGITLKQSFDPSAGEVDVFPQDIRRALLNLISNGFYAATKRMEAANGGDYEAVVVASTKNLGDCVEIRIRDNGTGIVPEVRDKMFNPFFTTKPTGEGTGLGLSISHDIIVKQHAGSIEVDTLPGEFTEITVILPRAAVIV